MSRHPPKHVPLAHDSTPRHLAGATRARAVAPRARVEITVVLRPRPLPAKHALHAKIARNSAALPHKRQALTPHELRLLHGAHDDDLADVIAFAGAHDLSVVHASARRNDITLSGSARAMTRAFGIDLRHFEHRSGSYRSHVEPVHLPADLQPIVQAVLGLDQTPVGRRAPGPVGPQAILRPTGDIAQAYRFPRGTGRGQRIALLEFSGGYHEADVNAFFRAIGRRPHVRSIPLLDSRNAPSSQRLLRSALKQRALGGVAATIETTMDIEIAGAIAPDAAIDVHFAPNHARGYHVGVLAALGLHCSAKRSRPATVISISWGANEAEWTPQALEAINGAIRRAHHMGVTVCCASGDGGSSGTRPMGLAQVEFPASSPYALACGGTTLDLTDGEEPASEHAWNSAGMATGGGVSGYFDQPEWQRDIPPPSMSKVWRSEQRPAAFRGRCVPDVAANADPLTGYEITVAGLTMPGGGTSAAAPLWAGLIAVLGGELKRSCGWINALLYSRHFRPALRDITHGENQLPDSTTRSFRAHHGWDACTGLGSPVGTKLLSALRG